MPLPIHRPPPFSPPSFSSHLPLLTPPSPWVRSPRSRSLLHSHPLLRSQPASPAMRTPPPLSPHASSPLSQNHHRPLPAATQLSVSFCLPTTCISFPYTAHAPSPSLNPTLHRHETLPTLPLRLPLRSDATSTSHRGPQASKPLTAVARSPLSGQFLLLPCMHTQGRSTPASVGERLRLPSRAQQRPVEHGIRPCNPASKHEQGLPLQTRRRHPQARRTRHPHLLHPSLSSVAGGSLRIFSPPHTAMDTSR